MQISDEGKEDLRERGKMRRAGIREGMEGLRDGKNDEWGTTEGREENEGWMDEQER